jgi:hypothetical protein
MSCIWPCQREACNDHGFLAGIVTRILTGRRDLQVVQCFQYCKPHCISWCKMYPPLSLSNLLKPLSSGMLNWQVPTCLSLHALFTAWSLILWAKNWLIWRVLVNLLCLCVMRWSVCIFNLHITYFDLSTWMQLTRVHLNLRRCYTRTLVLEILSFTKGRVTSLIGT